MMQIKNVIRFIFLLKFISLQRKDKILRNLVAQRMREIREQHNHTQEYLINNTHLHIAHYESQEKFPSLETISIFCEFYKMTIKTFFESFDHPGKIA